MKKVIKSLFFLLIFLTGTKIQAACTKDVFFSNDADGSAILGPTITGLRYPTEQHHAIHKFYADTAVGINIYQDNLFQGAKTNSLDILDPQFPGDLTDNFFFQEVTDMTKVKGVRYRRYAFTQPSTGSSSQTRPRNTMLSNLPNDSDTYFLETIFETDSLNYLNINIGIQFLLEVPTPYNTDNIDAKAYGIFFRYRDGKVYDKTTGWSPWMRLDKSEIDTRYLVSLDANRLPYFSISDDTIDIQKYMRVIKNVAFLQQDIRLEADTHLLASTLNELAFDINTGEASLKDQMITGVATAEIGGSSASNLLVLEGLANRIQANQLTFSGAQAINFNQNKIQAIKSMKIEIGLDDIVLDDAGIFSSGDLSIVAQKSAGNLGEIDFQGNNLVADLAEIKISKTISTESVDTDDPTKKLYFNFGNKSQNREAQFKGVELINIASATLNDFAVTGSVITSSSDKIVFSMNNKAFESIETNQINTALLLQDRIEIKNDIIEDKVGDLAFSQTLDFLGKNKLKVEVLQNMAGDQGSEIGIKDGPTFYQDGISFRKNLKISANEIDFNNEIISMLEDSTFAVGNSIKISSAKIEGINTIENVSKVDVNNAIVYVKTPVQDADALNVQAAYDEIANIPLSDLKKPTKDVDFGKERIKNVAEPVNSGDLVTVEYMRDYYKDRYDNFSYTHCAFERVDSVTSAKMEVIFDESLTDDCQGKLYGPNKEIVALNSGPNYVTAYAAGGVNFGNGVVSQGMHLQLYVVNGNGSRKGGSYSYVASQESGAGNSRTALYKATQGHRAALGSSVQGLLKANTNYHWVSLLMFPNRDGPQSHGNNPGNNSSNFYWDLSPSTWGSHTGSDAVYRYTGYVTVFCLTC